MSVTGADTAINMFCIMKIKPAFLSINNQGT